METVKFTDPVVAERFTSLVEKDRQVEQAGAYRGLFSKITPAMAYMMVRKGSNIIALKKDAPAESEIDAKKLEKPATGKALVGTTEVNK